MNPVIVVRNLHKRYGDVVAVKDVSFEVEAGEIFALLGPNGAGKTTTLDILEGIRQPDRGEVRILGYDPAQRAPQLHQRLGILLQSTAFFPTLRVGEILDLFGRLYRKRQPTELVLSKLGLTQQRAQLVKTLSTGQHQRLAIAVTFVHDADIYILDEPTLGLDPQVRRFIWELIEEIKAQGKTVLLTTHYIEEAERLCDRVGIMYQAELVAVDSPRALIGRLAATAKVEVRGQPTLSPAALEAIEAVEKLIATNNKFTLWCRDAQQVARALEPLRQAGSVQDWRVSQITLEDVFLELTGQEIEP